MRTSFLALVGIVCGWAVASAAEWQTDYDKALAAAKAAHKYVLLDFTGSDWCGPCIMMKKIVFSQPEFKKYAEDNLVLVELDYPKGKELPEETRAQNEKLMFKYGVDKLGFPTLILLSPTGKILGHQTGYDGAGPAAVIARLEKMRKS